MPLYTLTVSHVALHTAAMSALAIWFLLHDTVSHNALPLLLPNHTCYLSATCSFPPLYGSTKINIGDEKQHAPDTLL